VVVTWSCPDYNVLTTTTALTPICAGSASTVTLSSSTLPSGTYTVTYDLSGSNTASDQTTTMTFVAGSPGTGTFNIPAPALANSGTTTVTINDLGSGDIVNGGYCTSTISSNNTANIVVTATVVTDHFRSKASGNWHASATWESSADGATNWCEASQFPTSAATTITVRSPHTVAVGGGASGSNTTIENGGTLTFLGPHTLQWTGDFTNNGSLSVNAGTVEFAGSAAQTIGGTAATTFNNLTINNPNGVTITETSANTTTVNGALTLTSGNLDLGTAGLVLGSSATVSDPLSGGGWCVTSGSGALTRNGVVTSAVHFPVGTSSGYNGVYITNSGTTDDFSVRVQSGFDGANPPSGGSTAVVDRQWTITEANAGGSNADVQFYWRSTDHGLTFNAGSAVYVGRYNGSSWEQTFAGNNATSVGAYYTVSAGGFTSFSPFGVGNIGALPVELTAFSARRKESGIVLNWTTATELNNYGFDVERSTDRASWRVISFKPGHGNSASPKHYEYVDADARQSAQTLYYRLKQIDRDGSTSYSSVVELAATCNRFGLSQNYPNPFNGPTTITYVLVQSDIVSVKVCDMLGRDIATLVDEVQSAGSYSVGFDPSGLRLQRGYYLCIIQAGAEREARTMLYMP
jgi:hypothetical protein